MKFITRKHIWKATVLLALDGVVFGLTNARNASSFVLIGGFVLLVITFYYIVYALLTFVKLYGLSIKRKRRLAGVLSGLLSGIIALQSIGELNSHDVLVLLPLVVIGYAYSSYKKPGLGIPEA